MPKTKRSHHRTDEKRIIDGDELSNQSIVTEESDQIVEKKKRHHKKSSKKGKKHRSKRKPSPSESESDSSDSSESSSDSSSEEEVVKRKKQKKHKKNKYRRHETTDERKNNRDENEVEVLQIHEPPAKVHYISSDEERQQHHSKHLKRTDDRKRPSNEARPGDRAIDYPKKSKWDSPNDEFERKKKHEMPIERRVDERNFRGEMRGSNDNRPSSYRNDRVDRPGDRMDRGRQMSPAQRTEQRDRFDNRRNVDEFRRDRHDGGNQPEWRGRDRPQEPDRFRHNNKDEPNKKYRGEENRFGRQEYNKRERSVSPKPNINRGRFDDRRGGDRDNANNRYNYGENRRDARPHEPPRGSFGSGGHDRRPEIKREFNDREMDRPRNDRTRDRSEHEQRGGGGGGRNDRDAKRSPHRSLERNERPRSPMRSNPFRRNKNQSEDHSDFRHDGQKADRNDRSRSRDDRDVKPERNERFTKNGSGNRRRFNHNKESDNENYEWGKPGNSTKKEEDDEKEKSVEKEKPNFGLSGKLTEDANKVNGVVVKYAEPQEARRPKRKWRLYPFKNDQSLNTIYIHRQSCFLIGRDKKICEIAVDHPSCSKQHAALQYRLVNYERDDGRAARRVRPYIIDLESANGTFVNNKKIEPRKYFELFEKDVLKFGFSSREYVLLHEDSNADDEDEPIYKDEDDDDNDHVKGEREKEK